MIRMIAPLVTQNCSKTEKETCKKLCESIALLKRLRLRRTKITFWRLASTKKISLKKKRINHKRIEYELKEMRLIDF